MKEIRSIWLATKHNLYDSKRHFTSKLAEAFQRRGISVRVFDQDHFPVWKPSEGNPPDLTCSFHRLIPPHDETLPSSAVIPHYSILVDPVFYYRDIIKLPGSICSCVDRGESDDLSTHAQNNIFFLPHGIEKDIPIDDGAARQYDVVFLGSSYDPETLLELWKRKLPTEFAGVLEEATERVFGDKQIAFAEATKAILKERSVEVSDSDFFHMAYLVDSYIRGKDRVELIKSIKNAQVHVFGGINPRREASIRGWGDYFFDQENVTVHPAVTYEEGLEVLKQSKIALNSMPFFKDGSHERVLAALASGAMAITSASKYFREVFVEGEELLFYEYNDRSGVNDMVNHYLSHDKERLQVVDRGRLRVSAEHTWDNRVDTILNNLSKVQAVAGGQL